MQHISASSYQLIPWKNGSGTLEVIAASEAQDKEEDRWNNLDWQISITALADGTKFSYLENYDRWQMVIDGDGLYLDTPSGVIDLSHPYETVFYQGELPIVTRLTNGHVKVFNLMTSRGKYGGDILYIKVGNSFSLREGTHVFYALDDCIIRDRNGHLLNIKQHDCIQLTATEQQDIQLDIGKLVICSIYMFKFNTI